MPKKKPSRFSEEAAFAELRGMLKDHDAIRDVSWEHQVGVLVDKLVPREKRTYGTGNIELLAAELGIGIQKTLAAKLWNARKLAAALPPTQLRALLQHAKKVDFTLTASHVLAIVTIEDDQVRGELATECIEAKWSVRRLRREIHRRQGKKSHGGVGVAKLDSPEEVLDDLAEQTKAWLRRCRENWLGSGNGALTQPPTKIGEAEFNKQLRETEGFLSELQTAAKEVRSHLRELRLRVYSKSQTEKSKPTRKHK